MTTPTPILTGRDIGAAARATRALLDQLLDEAEIPFAQWTVLFTLGGSGPLPTSALVEAQVQGLRVTAAEGRATIDAAVSAGLVAPTAPDGGEPATAGDDAVLRFTAEGEGVYRPIREAVDRITVELYDALPAADLEATRRTLSEVTRRADARLALRG